MRKTEIQRHLEYCESLLDDTIKELDLNYLDECRINLVQVSSLIGNIAFKLKQELTQKTQSNEKTT